MNTQIEKPLEAVMVCIDGVWGGDLAGHVLGRFEDGWYSIASHISSNESWSRRDLSYHVRKLNEEYGWGLEPEWVGKLTSDELRERFPAGTTPPTNDGYVA